MEQQTEPNPSRNGQFTTVRLSLATIERLRALKLCEDETWENEINRLLDKLEAMVGGV